MIRELLHIAMAACVALSVAAPGVAESRRQGAACAAALAQGAVCEAANQYALELMQQDHLTAITVMQDVRSGSLFAFAASDPAKLDVNSSVLPLSTVKLMLAASWWDQGQPDSSAPGDKSVTEMIVSGDDNAGRRIASSLRKAVGTKVVLQDLERYGFADKASAGREAADFWTELPTEWKPRLTPAASYHSLDDGASAKEWEDTLSLGEERFTVTALSLSRFLQAVGNDGVMMRPIARIQNGNEGSRSDSSKRAVRILQENTARKLQDAMRGVVERGTGKNAAEVLKGTGWQIGGKTGTGPGPNPPNPDSDGWFAGLVIDPQGAPRFTVATFVRHGGLGGGHAAKISAELARFVSGTISKAQGGPNYTEKFAELERRSGGKIGIAAIDGRGRERVLYRADERFPMCSTFKMLAVAAVLKKVDEGKEILDRKFQYVQSDLLPNSPITSNRVKEGAMMLGDLCAAAVEESDNTAANLIIQTIGGPSGVTQTALALGDSVTRLERTEPEMNDVVPGDQRDVTTPAGMCRNLRQLLTGNFLTSASRDRLEGWLQHSVTGTTLIRSAVPADWTVGDKTGRNTGGSVNDVAIIRPPKGDPLFLAIYTFVPKHSSEERDKVVAEVARVAISELAPDGAF